MARLNPNGDFTTRLPSPVIRWLLLIPFTIVTNIVGLQNRLGNIFRSQLDVNFNKAQFTLWPRRIYFFLSLLLIFAAGFRVLGQGPDYESYEYFYNQAFSFLTYIKNPSLLFAKDPAYFILNSIFSNFGIPFETFLFLFAVFFVSLKMRAIAKLSNAPIYSAVIYFSYLYWMQDIITIRAGAADAIFLMSIPFLVEKKHVPYLLMNLLAASFHYSAVVYLLLIFLNEKNERPKLAANRFINK